MLPDGLFAHLERLDIASLFISYFSLAGGSIKKQKSLAYLLLSSPSGYVDVPKGLRSVMNCRFDARGSEGCCSQLMVWDGCERITEPKGQNCFP